MTDYGTYPCLRLRDPSEGFASSWILHGCPFAQGRKESDFMVKNLLQISSRTLDDFFEDFRSSYIDERFIIIKRTKKIIEMLKTIIKMKTKIRKISVMTV